MATRKKPTHDAAKDRQALELRLAGVPVSRIRTTLGYRTLPMAEAAIKRARLEQDGELSPEALRQLELERIDRLLQAVWAKAAKGDVASVDRVLSLTTMRLRIAGMNEAAVASPMVSAYDEAIADLPLRAADKALVAAGRRLAGRIDAAAGSIDPTAETKALYLIPHLLNVLRELGATPAARDEIVSRAPGAPAEGDAPAELSDLEAFRQRRGIESS